MSFEIGDVVGDYEILAVLGSGGMGKVYKVRNRLSNRVEAMKILLPNLEGDRELADRFLREIRVHASLEHPNIAGLRTAQRLDNQLVMIMECVDGTTLEELLHKGPINVRDGVRYVSQVLSALSYAHAQGIIHRDIKPDNMMLTAEGVVKLMDFGIAKMTADRGLTQTGQTVGSLYYMSPEQIQGATELDARSDLYSLGVSLYEIVTGKRPFEGDSQYSIMAAHLKETPAPPLELDPTMPAALNDIILMAIDRDPAKRFQSADAFRAAIESIGLSGLETVTSAVPLPPQPAAAATETALKKKSSRRVLYMVAGSLATIAVIVVAATQIPRWWRTSAVEAPATEIEQPATQPPEQEATPASPESEEQAGAPAETQATSAGEKSAMPEPVSPPPATRTLVPRSSASGGTKPAPSAGVASQSRERSVQSQPGRAAPVSRVGQEPAPAPPPAAKPAPVRRASSAAALEKAREHMMLIAVRAGAVRGSLDNLRRGQRASGLGLRADMAAADKRMEYLLDEAESSLKSGDAEAAGKRLDAAERELEKLEGFLGI